MLQDLTVVRLRAQMAQEAETEQAKLPEVTLKKAIDGPATNGSEAENQEENACKALTTTGEIPAPPRVPVPAPSQSQSLSKAKGFILLWVCHHLARHSILS